jgi:histone-lysine N-methyltransferase SETMAR
MKKFPKENDTEFTRKSMLTIVWNQHGFHLIKVLEKGRKFNAGYYIAEILEPLSQWRSTEAADNERKLMVHADNASSHPAKLSTQYFKANRMKSAPHPPYSPDLALSDFYLFEYVKRCLAGLSFEDTDQLLAAIEGVREGIAKVTLEAVFLEWMDRLRKGIAANEEHTE